MIIKLNDYYSTSKRFRVKCSSKNGGFVYKRADFEPGSEYETDDVTLIHFLKDYEEVVDYTREKELLLQELEEKQTGKIFHIVNKKCCGGGKAIAIKPFIITED